MNIFVESGDDKVNLWGRGKGKGEYVKVKELNPCTKDHI